MAFGPDSIKSTPGVIYDLIRFVVKNSDSDQITRDGQELDLSEGGGGGGVGGGEGWGL